MFSYAVRIIFTTFTLGIAFLSPTRQAEAVPIPSSSVAAPIAATRGDGLAGAFYDPGSRMTSLTAADDWISSHAANANFVSTQIDYPNGSADTTNDSTSLSAFLGTDAGTLSGSGGTALSGSIFLFTGFITIESAFDTDPSTVDIDIDFALGSDDGFRLSIGGVELASAGERLFGFSTVTASFAEEGLYAVELLFFEDQTESGIEWYSTIRGGLDSGTPLGFSGIVPTSVLSTTPIPEPSTALLMGLGLVGLGAAKKRSGKGKSLRFLASSLVSIAVFIGASSASAATLNVVGGQLLGASGVIVDGSSYNVEFLDGTCIALYNGCDEVSDFTFQTLAAATLASQALLDQVFLGGAILFDTDPALTSGCFAMISCAVWTPYGFAGSGTVSVVSAFMIFGVGGSTLAAELLLDADSSDAPGGTLALWAPIPEPGTAVLMGLGLLGLSVRKRRVG